MLKNREEQQPTRKQVEEWKADSERLKFLLENLDSSIHKKTEKLYWYFIYETLSVSSLQPMDCPSFSSARAAIDMEMERKKR